MSAQPETNFNAIAKLIDASVNQILQKDILPGKINLEFNSSGEYSVFKNIMVLSLLKRNKKVEMNNKELNTLGYSIQNAKVSYNDIQKNGIFGGYSVSRSVALNGNYFITVNGEIKDTGKIELVKTDTVDYDELKNLENAAYPFTHAKIPSIPFFSSIWEPIIALGTVAVTIFLFFTVRSN